MPLEITNNLSSSRQMEFSDERVLIRLLSDRYMQISFYEVGMAVSITFRSHQYSWINVQIIDSPAFSGIRRGLLGNLEGDPFLSYSEDASYFYRSSRNARNFTSLGFYSNIPFSNELNACKFIIQSFTIILSQLLHGWMFGMLCPHNYCVWP